MLFQIFGGFFGIVTVIAMIQVAINQYKGYWAFMAIDAGILALSFFSLAHYPDKAKFILPITVVTFVIWIFLERERKNKG